MYCEDVQCIIDTEEELELGGIIAGSSTNYTIYDSGPRRDITGSWSDRNETSNDSGAEADSGPFLLKSVIKDTPGDTSNGSREVGDNGRHNCTQIRRESRTSIEAEPTNPEEDGTDDNVGDVVRTKVELMGAMSASLAEHEGICQSS